MKNLSTRLSLIMLAMALPSAALAQDDSPEESIMDNVTWQAFASGY
ncbi:MAG: hypothetical protein IPL19_29560 [Sandaracinaceae bacterium]|nr:hypothetical protein [Sandaracinaceae bacterium]MBK8412106.1 hypothetical protein [Sandaracinaceae bacterium]